MEVDAFHHKRFIIFFNNKPHPRFDSSAPHNQRLKLKELFQIRLNILNNLLAQEIDVSKDFFIKFE
jgi:hypothetical protein